MSLRGSFLLLSLLASLGLAPATAAPATPAPHAELAATRTLSALGPRDGQAS